MSSSEKKSHTTKRLKMKKTNVKVPTTIKNESLVEKRRQQILEAAVKLFSIKGYHATTLRELSKESGITLGNLYDYISTKEDILYIINEKATHAVMEAISKKNEGELSPVEKLEQLITSGLEVVNKYQDLVLIIYQESHAMRKEVLYTLLKGERGHLEQYEKIITEGIKKGYFRPVNVRLLANMIKMLTDLWVIRRWDLKGNVSFKEMRQGILDFALNGIHIQSSKSLKGKK